MKEPELSLTIPLSSFREALRPLVTGQSGSTRIRAGRRWSGGEVVEVIGGPPSTGSPSIELSLVERFVLPIAAPEVLNASALLQIGGGDLRGQARAWIARSSGAWALAHQLYLPGAGLRIVRLLDPDGEAAIAEELDAAASERLSRSIGGLGEGPVRAIMRLRVGLVGAGRLSSAILSGLLNGLGVRGVVLVDPDRVERHNCGEGGFFTDEDIGQPKVDAWQNKLARAHPFLDVTAVPRSAAHREALQALARCHVIVAAPDQPGARIAAAAVATLHARMLLDAGVLIPIEDRSAMGVDVRLIPPERCLLCCGSVAGEEHGAELLASPDRERAFMQQRAWNSERAGSLLSLNTLAAGIALRMLEDCAARRLEGPQWCQADFRHGMLMAAPRAVPPRGNQPCFCGISGEADAGYSRVLGILNQRRASAGSTPHSTFPAPNVSA